MLNAMHSSAQSVISKMGSTQHLIVRSAKRNFALVMAMGLAIVTVIASATMATAARRV